MTNSLIARLLFGSLGLFAILSAFRWLTRRVDWYQATSAAEPQAAA